MHWKSFCTVVLLCAIVSQGKVEAELPRTEPFGWPVIVLVVVNTGTLFDFWIHTAPRQRSWLNGFIGNDMALSFPWKLSGSDSYWFGKEIQSCYMVHVEHPPPQGVASQFSSDSGYGDGTDLQVEIPTDPQVEIPIEGLGVIPEVGSTDELDNFNQGQQGSPSLGIQMSEVLPGQQQEEVPAALGLEMNPLISSSSNNGGGIRLSSFTPPPPQGGSGGDPGDGDSGGPGSGQEQEDPDEEEAFNDLQKKVKKALKPTNACRHPFERYRLVKRFLAFAKAHPSYSVRSYAAIRSLLKYEFFTIELLSRAGVSLSVSLSAFGNTFLGIGRSLGAVTFGVVASVFPWFCLESGFFEHGLVFLGSAMFTGVDNGFAHLTNSSYALDWASPEFGAFGMRTFVANWIHLMVTKYLAGGIVNFMAFLSRGGLIPVLTLDVVGKPVVSYFSLAALFSLYPVVAIPAGPNPYGPYSYPWPKYCPSIKWIPWLEDCSINSTANNSLPLEEEPSLNQTSKGISLPGG